MSEAEASSEGTWDVGWEGHERAQLLRMAALPLPLKLRWLEEAQVMVEHMQKRREQRLAASDDQAPKGGSA